MTSSAAHATNDVDELFATAPDVSSTGSPAHAQIEQWLMGLIDSGGLLPDDKLPKEKDLAALLGVSRMTLRQSLGSLETRGVLERIPGRQGGTFIRQPRIECDITGLAGFTEQLRRGHVRASARVVSSDVVPANRAVAKALELAPDTDVYEVVRVRSARREPLALERSYLPVEPFPGLLDKRLSGSLYTRMRRDYGLAPQTRLGVPRTLHRRGAGGEAARRRRRVGAAADRTDGADRVEPAGRVRARPVPPGQDQNFGPDRCRPDRRSPHCDTAVAKRRPPGDRALPAIELVETPVISTSSISGTSAVERPSAVELVETPLISTSSISGAIRPSISGDSTGACGRR